VAAVLVTGLGLVCTGLGFLLAFTPYGIAAVVVGAALVGTGMVRLLARDGPGRGPTSARDR
jgi:hypothetical protein